MAMNLGILRAGFDVLLEGVVSGFGVFGIKYGFWGVGRIEGYAGVWMECWELL